MNKNLLSFSVIFLCICIVLSSWLISQSLKSNQNENKLRYELIAPNNSHNIILFDKQSGESWQKVVAPDEGPTNWEKQKSPVSLKSK